MKAPRNKTIDFGLDEGKQYLDRCLRIEDPVDSGKIRNRTIVGDFFETAGFIPDNIADLCIVDPPYNLDKNFNGSIFHQTSDEAYEAYTEKWIGCLKSKLKEDASIYVCCDWKSSPVIGLVLKRHFHVRNRITWQREKGRGSKNNWKNGMEDIWYATCSDDYVFHAEDVMIRRKVIAPYKDEEGPRDWEETKYGNFRNTYPSNFWDDISIPYWSMPENTAHPTQKPEKLIAKLILASSDPGDLVLDPFLGSGTTSVTAKKLKRDYIGIEMNPVYCAWAEKRLEMADKSDRIQGYTGGVFWERNTLAQQKNDIHKRGILK